MEFSAQRLWLHMVRETLTLRAVCGECENVCLNILPTAVLIYSNKAHFHLQMFFSWLLTGLNYSTTITIIACEKCPNLASLSKKSCSNNVSPDVFASSPTPILLSLISLPPWLKFYLVSFS